MNSSLRIAGGLVLAVILMFGMIAFTPAVAAACGGVGGGSDCRVGSGAGAGSTDVVAQMRLAIEIVWLLIP